MVCNSLVITVNKNVLMTPYSEALCGGGIPAPETRGDGERPGDALALGLQGGSRADWEDGRIYDMLN